MSTMRSSIAFMGIMGVLAMLPLNAAKADQVGRASWYAFHSRTASGARMDASAMTAAHPSLPFGTKVLVQNLNNGRSVTVTINDRGPFVHGRIIDVSKAAAASLGMIGSGTAEVRISTAGGGGGGFLGASGRQHGLLQAASEVRSFGSHARSHERLVMSADRGHSSHRWHRHLASAKAPRYASNHRWHREYSAEAERSWRKSSRASAERPYGEPRG